MEITRAEERVRDNKKRARRTQGNSAAFFVNRATALQQSIYYWKAVGDAIAFLYIDRLALKHVYYNTRNLYPKQSSGFITGSQGFALVEEIVAGMIRAGYPALASDLTNTIRYGDICVLRGPDPLLLEVKSSKTKDRRSLRQRRDLKRLAEFFVNDRLDNFRGLPEVRRVAVHTEYKTYQAEFNRCIRAAYKEGYSVASPEEGIVYIAIAHTDTPTPDILEQASIQTPWVVFLNAHKSDRTWTPYYPFTLLISDHRALYDFILGRLFVVVMLDLEVMRAIVTDLGYVPAIAPESEYTVRASHPDTGVELRISEHLLLRTAFEALSLKWIIQSTVAGLEAMGASRADRHA